MTEYFKQQIYINGVHIPKTAVYGYEDREAEGEPTHQGGYSGFSVNITDYVNVGSTNTIAVKVDNYWDPYLTPRGGDHQFSGGIYRDVTLTAVNKTHIDWYGNFIWTPAICNPAYQESENRPDNQYKDDFERNGTGIINTLDDPNIEGEYVSEEVMLQNLENKTSDVEIRSEITNTDDEPVEVYTRNIIKDADENVVATFESSKEVLASGEKKIIIAKSDMIKNIKLWSFDEPNLYTAYTEVYKNGVKVDDYEDSFGFRSAQFKLDGFYLNGVKTLLDGANVHQDHGGWADAVTDAGFYRDVKYVKETGFNFIRGSHYPHDTSFAYACDELGIGFWSEGGLWSIGGSNDDDTVDGKISDWMRTAYPLNGTEEQKKEFEQSCMDLAGTMVRMNRNHPSVIVWSMGNEAFFSSDEVTQDIKELVNEMRNYSHSIDFTRKAGLGGTQRKDLNVLAVCDVAGGNGDGGTDAYTNFYLPHLVAEYSSGQNDRPGSDNFQYAEIAAGKSGDGEETCTTYKLPSKTITLADGSQVESSSAGLAIWCMYHHGSVGGRALRIMGLMDYYRLPTTRYYLYREGRTGKSMPEKSAEGTAARIELTASTDITLADVKTNKTVITNDGKTDAQIIATLVDENGTWVNYTPDELVMEVVSGNGNFPTGKSYTFVKDKTFWDGMAAIEFRSYYSGDTVIRAYVPGTDIVSNEITITTENVLGIDEGEEPENFLMTDPGDTSVKLGDPESYGVMDAAYNRQTRADSFNGENIPFNAVDNDDSTCWESEVEGPGQSWWIYLENTYYLQKVKVNMGDEPVAYTIYRGANDDDNTSDEWIKVADCDGTEPEIDFGGVYTGAIKITFTGTEEGKRAKLYTINAYGTTFTGYAQNSTILLYTRQKALTAKLLDHI